MLVFYFRTPWSAPACRRLGQSADKSAHSRVILYLVLTAEEISPRHLGKTFAALTGHTQNW